MEEEITDKKKASGNYVIAFYDCVQALNEAYALYINIMVELSNIYGDDYSKMEQSHTNTMMGNAQNLRFWITQTYIRINAMQSKLKIELDIKETVKKLQNTYIMERDVVEGYIIHINNVLVTEVMQDLLKNSQDLLDKVYK